MDGMVRWCTPSIHPECPSIHGVYSSDISISYHSLGNPSQGTGIFGEAYKLAAKAYKADKTLFSVNGSSGSNFVVMRALKHQLGKMKMLAQRNIHKSASVAIEDYKIDVEFLAPHYDDKYQVFVPSQIGEIIEKLKKDTDINVLFLTNPTYEGLSLDLPKLVKQVRNLKRKIIIYIDEAWGAHLPFSKLLPVCAMKAGADICVQSTHKQGSGLQQTSMIHWKKGLIDEKYLLDSYKSLMTTSPSFHLLASLDGARYLFETRGELIINRLIQISDLFRFRLKEVSGVREVKLGDLSKKYEQVKYLDRSKILVNVEDCGVSGVEMAHFLEKDYKIIVEKYEMNNILFMNTFQNSETEVNQTILAMKEVVKKHGKKQNKKKYFFPNFPIDLKKDVPLSKVAEFKSISLKLNHAIGLTAAEDVVPYPPGIPLIVKGEIISKYHVAYLEAIKKTKGLMSVVMNDKNINNILVLKKNLYNKFISL